MTLLSTILFSLATSHAAAQLHLHDIDVDGWYTITALHSNKVLEIVGGSDADKNGTQLQQNQPTGADNQLFRFKQVQSGWFVIVNKHSGKVLQIRDNSLMDHARVEQWSEKKHADNQMFALSEDTGGGVAIISRSTGYGFDVLGGAGAKADATPLVVYPNGTALNQKFKLTLVIPGAKPMK
jgi:hypothetical protein